MCYFPEKYRYGTVTGPLRDRYGGSVNFRECTHFSYKKCLRRPFTLKSTVTGPLRDRYGTVTGPLRGRYGAVTGTLGASQH